MKIINSTKPITGILIVSILLALWLWFLLYRQQIQNQSLQQQSAQLASQQAEISRKAAANAYIMQFQICINSNKSKYQYQKCFDEAAKALNTNNPLSKLR